MGMRKGMDMLCKHAAALPADPAFPFYVMYTNNRDVARELVKKLEHAGITVDEDHIIQVGAAIGSHIGPDACGLVYVAAK
jgi:fatty acid-binding protein DegV